MARVIVVVKRTAYEAYVREAQDERVQRLIEKNDPTVRPMLGSFEEHERTVEEVTRALDRIRAKVTWISRADIPFDAKRAALVVTVGGDGTLLAASHSVASTPLLGVNSAPSHSVGFFCAARKDDFADTLERALSGRLKRLTLSRMEVLLGKKAIARRVLNEALFCHASPAATSRYILEVGRRVEQQKSSGFWVGPAAGSTAAQHSAGGRILPLGSRSLQLVVREPYNPAGERLRMTRVLVGPDAELVVRSKMDDARIFIDGPHDVFRVRLGDELVFRRSPESLTILGLHGRREWRGE